MSVAVAVAAPLGTVAVVSGAVYLCRRHGFRRGDEDRVVALT